MSLKHKKSMRKSATLQDFDAQKIAVAIVPTARFVFWLNKNRKDGAHLLGMDDARRNPTIILIAGGASDTANIFNTWIDSHWRQLYEDVLLNMQLIDCRLPCPPTLEMFLGWFEFVTHRITRDYAS